MDNQKHGRIYLTRHVTERFQERFPNHCEGLYSQGVRRVIYDLINSGDNNRSFLNNTNFIQYLHKRYGVENKYVFIVNKDVVFVMKEEASRKVAITCLERGEVTFLKETRKFKARKKEALLTPAQEKIIINEDFDDFLSEIQQKKPTKLFF